MSLWTTSFPILSPWSCPTFVMWVRSLCVFVCMNTCICVCLCTCVQACMQVWMCIRVCAYACVPVCVGGGALWQFNVFNILHNYVFIIYIKLQRGLTIIHSHKTTSIIYLFLLNTLTTCRYYMTMVIEGGIDEIPNNILGKFYDIKLAYRYSAAEMDRFYPQINF